MFKAPGARAFFSAETEDLSGKQKTYRCIILQELCLMRNGKSRQKASKPRPRRNALAISW